MAALILMSVNGGAYTAGAQIVPGGATIALKAVAQSFWTKARWEIFGFPPNSDFSAWSGPGAGDWTYDPVAQVWRSTQMTPAAFTLPAALTCWGKWLVRLIVNDGYDPTTGKGLQFDQAGNVLPSSVVDISGGWHVISPEAGLYDVSPEEATQFDPFSYIRDLQFTLRTIDKGIGSSGGTVIMGGDVSGPSSMAKVVGWNGVALDASMVAPADGSFVQKKSGKWAAITAAAAALAILGASVTGTAANNQVLVGTGAGTAQWQNTIPAGAVPSLAGEVTGPITATIVSGPFSTASLQWLSTVATPKLGVIAAASDVATTGLTIQGQYAFASATGTHRQPGNITFDIGAPTNGGTAEAGFQFTRNGSLAFGAQIGAVTGAGIIALWLGAASPGVGNYAIGCDGANTILNAPSATGSIDFGNGSVWLGQFDGVNKRLHIGSLNAGPIFVDWSTATAPYIASDSAATSFTIETANTTTTATISVLVSTMTADAAPGSVTLQAGNAWASASTNTTGADVFVKGGLSKAAGSDFTNGSIHLRTGAYTNTNNSTSFHGYTLIEEGTTILWRFGTWRNNANNAVIWAVDGGSPSTSNYTFEADAGSITLNAPPSGQMFLAIGNSTSVLTSSTASLAIGGTGFSPTIGPVVINWATPTTPTILGGSSATKLTVGTNNASAVLNLAGDANVVGALIGNLNVQLCSGTSSWGSGSAVVGVTNATTAPTANPTGGGILYALAAGDSSGDPFWRDSNGNVMPMAQAQVAKSAAFTLGNGIFYWVDDSAGSFNIQLPAPVKGFLAYVWDKTGSFQANPVTFVRNGSEKINNSAANKTGNQNFHLYVIGSNGTDWVVV